MPRPDCPPGHRVHAEVFTTRSTADALIIACRPPRRLARGGRARGVGGDAHDAGAGQ